MKHSLQVLISYVGRYEFLLVFTQGKLSLAQCCESLCTYDPPILVVRYSVSKVT